MLAKSQNMVNFHNSESEIGVQFLLSGTHTIYIGPTDYARGVLDVGLSLMNLLLKTYYGNFLARIAVSFAVDIIHHRSSGT